MNIKVEINQEKEPESLLPLADNAEIEQIVHGIVDGINEQFGTVFRAHMPLDLQKMILDTFRKPKADEQVKVMKVDDIVRNRQDNGDWAHGAFACRRRSRCHNRQACPDGQRWFLRGHRRSSRDMRRRSLS